MPDIPGKVEMRDGNVSDLSGENVANIATYLELVRKFGAGSKGHSGDTLEQHLVGTYLLLKEWGNNDDLCLAGLFHSIYGTQWYEEGVTELARRGEVAAVIGVRAEELAYLFCAVDRSGLWADRAAGSVTLCNRLEGGEVVVPQETRRELIELEVANVVEQLGRVAEDDDWFLQLFLAQVEEFRDRLSRGAVAAAEGLGRRVAGVGQRGQGSPDLGGQDGR